MRIFLRGISFHCILLDYIHEEKEDKKNAILQRFRQELKAGSIKPIVRTVFQNDEIEQSFRYMTAGKHIGKVLIKIRAEEKDLLSGPELLLKEAIPRFSCDSDKVYIICGGVGGMGLELADWLVLRRAKKLILTSRNGVTNGYQALRINLWKSYGAITIVSTNDISKKEEVETLLKIAEKLGPVAGIFNLAAVTDDKLFEMCNAEAFESVSMPKSRATQLLDRISRKLCPNLKHFVVFSSVSCGYGNAGQTNYGFANSSCERICEQRRKAGLPGLVIQWGAVGDVGMMTKIENPEKIFGLKEQPIRSCLQVLDVFLNQPETIVTSYIMGDKNTDYAKSESLVEAVATILGIEDLKSISMYSPLPELGMDSITGLEIKQMVEQQYNIFLSTKELISLTFSQLEDMEKSGKKISIDVKNENNILASIPYIRNALFTKTTSLNLLNVEPIVKLPSQLHESEESVENTVFFFPPTDGIAPPMEPLAKCLKMKVMCFQYHCVEQTDSLEKQATFYTSYIRQMIPSSVEFKIVAYSYGVIMAMEVLKILCSENRIGRVILIDGSLEMVKTLRSVYFGSMTELNDIQIKLMLDIISALKPPLASNEMEKEFQQARSWEAKLDLLLSKFPDDLSYGKDNLKILTEYLYHRYKTLNQYHFHLNEKLNVKATILKAKKSYLSIPLKINLKEYFAVTPEEYFINENHFTILSNNKTIELVNNAFVKCNE
nr:fatty acid synthase [Kerria lacca]